MKKKDRQKLQKLQTIQKIQSELQRNERLYRSDYKIIDSGSLPNQVEIGPTSFQL